MDQRWVYLIGSVLVVTGMAVGSLSGMFNGQAIKNLVGGKKKGGSIDQALLDHSKRINKTLPTMIDTETRFENAESVDRELHYNYTLIRKRAADINVKMLSLTLTPQLRKEVCSSADLKFVRDNNIPLNFSYFGNDGEEVATIVINPGSCN